MALQVVVVLQGGMIPLGTNPLERNWKPAKICNSERSILVYNNGQVLRNYGNNKKGPMMGGFLITITNFLHSWLSYFSYKIDLMELHGSPKERVSCYYSSYYCYFVLYNLIMDQPWPLMHFDQY